MASGRDVASVTAMTYRRATCLEVKRRPNDFEQFFHEAARLAGKSSFLLLGKPHAFFRQFRTPAERGEQIPLHPPDRRFDSRASTDKIRLIG